MSKTLTARVDTSASTPTAGHKPARSQVSAAVAKTKPPQHHPDRVWSFTLVHSGEWEPAAVDGSTILLPILDILVDKPGCNGVKQRSAGLRPTSALRDGRRIEAGHIIVPVLEYLQEIKSEDERGEPNTYYYARWEDVTEYPDGYVAVRHQAEDYDGYRIDLLRRGLISPPPPHRVDTLVRGRQSALRRAQAHPEGRQYWDEKVKRLQSEIAALPAAYERTLALAARKA